MSNTTVPNAAKYLRTDDFTMQKYYFYFATRLQSRALYYFMIFLLKHNAPCKDKNHESMGLKPLQGAKTLINNSNVTVGWLPRGPSALHR